MPLAEGREAPCVLLASLERGRSSSSSRRCVARSIGATGTTEQRIEHVIVHTGQHYDPELSEVFFEELEIPRADLNLGVGSGPHGKQTGRMLEQFEQFVLESRPDALIVYGDTNSTIAGALVGAKQQVLVAHVESGLRSFNRRMPEEINRVATDHVSECSTGQRQRR